MQYYDTNIVFSVGWTCSSDRKNNICVINKTLTHCIYSGYVSLKVTVFL